MPSAASRSVSSTSSSSRSVFVCTLAIQGAAVRLMFSMGRDGGPAARGPCGATSATFRTPANAADRGRHPRGDPVPARRTDRRSHVIAATGMIYLSTSCATSACSSRAGVAGRTRRRGSGSVAGACRSTSSRSSGAGSCSSTSLCGRRRSCSATSAVTAARYWNPLINGLFAVNGQKLDGLPAWPLFETLVGPLLVFGVDLLPDRGPRSSRRDRGRRGRPARASSAR